jgi:DNA-binding winged helix-turn-helix (wHTH) protein
MDYTLIEGNRPSRKAAMRQSLGEQPVLIAQTGELDGSRWTLESERFTIGRSPDCELCIPDRQVSRHHARIRKSIEGFVLEDLKSKNGTHLNGVLITEPVMLQDGDVIQIAVAMRLIYVGTEATIPLAMDVKQMGLGKLRLDPQAHRIWIGQEEIDPPLSPPQYRLIALLYENPDRIVSREEIVEKVWPDSRGEGVSEQAIDALVRRLRDRLAEYDPKHTYIITVRGHGFRLDNPV